MCTHFNVYIYKYIYLFLLLVYIYLFIYERCYIVSFARRRTQAPTLYVPLAPRGRFFKPFRPAVSFYRLLKQSKVTSNRLTV